MTQGTLPFKYLGVPLSSQNLSVMQCSPLIKRILERIDCWAAKLLSYVGRVQLIKSVLYEMQNYWCQIFVLPQKVIKMIQATCQSFLWTGKPALFRRTLVAWERLCLPKYAGGLGLVNMKLWNRAAICKLLWNLAQKKDKIWGKWVHGYYVEDRRLIDMPIPGQCSWIVRKILGAREYLQGIGNDWLYQSKFSIQKIYKAMQGSVQKVEWNRMICNNQSPLKCIFISWLLLQNGLATCERLLKVGIVVDRCCCLCGRDEETLDSLFFGCAMSGGIWLEVSDWCEIKRCPKTWREEMLFMVTQCQTVSDRQSMYRCALSVVIYEVWKERNNRRMKGSERSVEAVIHSCKLLVVLCSRKDPKLRRMIPDR